MAPTPSELLIPPTHSGPLISRVAADKVGWQYLNMVVLHLEREQTFELTIDDYEYIMVILGGRCNIKTSRADYLDIGRRAHVFAGMPWALYLPNRTEFEIEALSDHLEIAACWSPTEGTRPPRLIRPHDVALSIQGGGSATTQRNLILPPGDTSQRLLVYEEYTPGGNWASYPPHRHDQHRSDANGKLVEAALEEITFFKFDRPNGYAIQRVYTEDESIDSTMVVYTDDVIVVPKGYHTLASAPGYTTYGLHFLAGSARAEAATDDPAYAWVRQTWLAKDTRLPVVDHGMEPPPQP